MGVTTVSVVPQPQAIDFDGFVRTSQEATVTKRLREFDRHLLQLEKVAAAAVPGVAHECA